jgi:hypothetical protein
MSNVMEVSPATVVKEPFSVTLLFVCRRHTVVFIKLKDNKIFSGFIQTQQIK